MRPDWRDPRLLLLLAAAALLASSFFAPPYAVAQAGYDALLVVDITGSMNTRDYEANGRPQSRLEAAKAALGEMLGALPCSSRVALAVFSERRPFLLYEPVEVCGNYSLLGGSVDALDWRMAWEGDSHIAAGLYRAIELAKELRADLLFLTDGQEAPPLPASGGPTFDGQPGDVRGLIVGVGGYPLSPIPKFNDEGREIGFYGVDDVPHENRHGLPPPGAEQREGFNARNAPFGATMVAGVEHLSSVREPYLRSLAEKTGLAYAHLVSGEPLDRAYRSAARARSREVKQDSRPFFAASAGALLFAAFLATLLIEWSAARRGANARRTDKGPERRKK